MSRDAVTTVPLRRLTSNGAATLDNDQVAVEEPLEIRLNGEAIVTLMRTPGEDRELVTGFLFTEGIIQQAGDILKIEPCLHTGTERPGNILNVTLGPHITIDPSELRRHVVASSSCGVCSKTSIAAVRRLFPAIESSLRVDAGIIHGLPEKLRAAQETFARTGGLHACGWFRRDGTLVAIREDVGRHNALDKLVGYRLMQGACLEDGILQVSGRVAFEIVQKALATQFSVIAAISAPTSLAVEFAEENGQTLIGFVRDGRMNLYTHPQRVISGGNPAA